MKKFERLHAECCVYLIIVMNCWLGTVFGETGFDRCDFPCPHTYDPVCGSDGKTYSNECQLRTAACRTSLTIKTKHRGRCGSGATDIIMPAPIDATSGKCDFTCPTFYDPVCGSDGKNYSNECNMNLEACRSRTKITVAHRGRCTPKSGGCDFRCPIIYEPVCGSEGTTFMNECQMRAVSCRAGTRITMAYRGICRLDIATTTSTECSWFCATLYDPVCGSDGKTYSNQCFMSLEACGSRTRITVAHRGRCESDITTTPSNNCNWLCPQIYKPVCGSDGKTYSNTCLMRLWACRSRIRITVAYRRKCRSDYVRGG